MKNRKDIYCLALSLICFSSSYAQQLLLRHFSKENGLVSNTVYKIISDKCGFLWFCTDQGVSKFDGHQFINFTSKDGLPDNEIFNIKEDGENRFWLECYNNKPCYIKGGSVYNDKNDALCRFVQQQNSNIPSGVNKYSPDLCLPDLKALYIDKSAVIAAYSYLNQAGIDFYFEHRGKAYFLNRGALMSVYKNEISCLLPFRLNGIIAANKGIYTYTFGDNQSVLYQLDIIGDSVKIIQKKHLPFKVFSLTALRNSDIMVMTENGVVIWRGSQLFDKHITILKNKPVSCGIVDEEGNYWFSTYDDGVYMLPSALPEIYRRQITAGNANVKSICVTAAGAIMAGYNDGRVDIIDKGNVDVVNFDSTKILSRILKIMPLSSTKSLVLSDNGIYEINGENEMHSTKCSISSLKAGCLDKNHCLLGFSRGALRVNLNTKKIEVLWNKRTTAIAKQDDIIWLGTLDGVYYSRNGIISRFRPDNTLSHSRIVDFATCTNSIFIATHLHGIYIWNGNKLSHIDDSNGLNGSICKKLFKDDENTIWVCTNKGLDKIIADKECFDIVHFIQSEDLPGNALNDVFVKQGKVYLATPEGIIIMKEDNKKGEKPINAFISSVQTLDSVYSGDKTFILNSRRKDVRINYTAVSYSTKGNLVYKYVLSGASGDTIITNLNSVNFSSLNPGSYRFMVWAKNKYGPWCAQYASVSFIIKPAFWQTYWFIILAFIITGAIVYRLFRMRVDYIKKSEREKTSLHKQMAELEMQALRAQINPHFVFNALNSIQHYYAQNDERSANRYMTTFAMLIRQTLTNSRNQWIVLSEEICLLENYIVLEHMRFRSSFLYHILVSDEVALNSIMIPAMIIQPYIENAIYHGLRHLPENTGILEINFFIKEMSLICRIDDNGIGMYTSAPYENIPKNHKSLGMAITRDRLNTINKLYNTEIAVFLSTSRQADTDSGTCIDICIPLQNLPKNE